MSEPRYLIVTADDFGIGPAVSQGILDLAGRGRVTCTVLLVTSPHAAEAVRAWQSAGEPVELGWHPCLTLDRPVLPAEKVLSLVQPDGRFWPLTAFLRRLAHGEIEPREVRAELHAQYRRFRELVGRPPSVVNAHHHLHIFRLVGTLLRGLLAGQAPRPYLRRVREPWRTLVCVPGERGKRLGLSMAGARAARAQQRDGFPGGDWLAGLGPSADLAGWLRHVPGQVVELVCHPGLADTTLADRDSLHAADRVRQLRLLHEDGFEAACREAGFTLLSPGALHERRSFRSRHAA